MPWRGGAPAGAKALNLAAEGRNTGRAEAIGLALLVALSVLPAFLDYPFPSQDGPLHSVGAFVFSRTADPTLAFGRYLVPNLPLSGQGWVFLTIGLDQVLPFPVAERLALALLLAAFPLAGIGYARLTGRTAWPAAAILCVVAHSWVLVMGFWSFMLGMALIPLACGVAFRLGGRGPTVARVVGLAAILLGLGWIHAFAALLGAVLAGVTALGATLEARAGPRGRLSVREAASRLGLVALAGVPLLAYLVGVNQSYAGMPSTSPGGVVFEPWSARLADLFRLGPGGVSVVTGVLFVGAAVWIAVQAVRGGRARWLERTLVLAAAALVVAYLLAPIRAHRWAFLSPRLLFAGMLALGMAAFPAPRSGWGRLGALLGVALALTFSALSLGRMADEIAPLAARVAELHRPPGSPFVPLELAPERIRSAPRYADLTLHLGTRSMLSSGGITPYLYALNPAIQPLLYREHPTRLLGRPPPVYGYLAFRCRPAADAGCSERRRRYSDRIALAALPWGELVIFHPPPILSARLAVRGFRRLLAADGVEQWRARPAWLTVRVPALAESRIEARVQLLPSPSWLRLARGGVSTGPRGRLRVGPLPAGPIRLKLVRRRDPGVRPSAAAAKPLWVSGTLALAPGSTRALPGIGLAP